MWYTASTPEKHFRFQNISNRAEMGCGTPLKGHHPVVNSRGGWSCHIHAKGTVVNSLLLPPNRERHNGFLANSRDTSIEPETGADCLSHVFRISRGKDGDFFPPIHFYRKIWWNGETVWSCRFLTFCLSNFFFWISFIYLSIPRGNKR